MTLSLRAAHSDVAPLPLAGEDGTELELRWGPLPLKGPNGEAPGYGVLAEQKGPAGSTTVERDYIPGLGMVRSLTITSLGTEMVSCEELVLTAAR